MSNGAILVLMAFLFLGFGYMGVPVTFVLIGVNCVATSTPAISAKVTGTPM